MMTSLVMVFGLAAIAGRRAVEPEADSLPDDVAYQAKEGGTRSSADGE